MNVNTSPFQLKNTKAYEQWRDSKLLNAQNNAKKAFITLKMTPPLFFDVSRTPDDLEFKNTKQPTVPSQETRFDVLKQSKLTIEKILEECDRDNYCLYTIENPNQLTLSESKHCIKQLAQACGIVSLDKNICSEDDGLSLICMSQHKGQHEYIPYSNKRLNWHTDGYYNALNSTINSMLLHCYQEALSGGESAFIDHEIAYILLRDQNPNWIKALSQPNVMTIPANVLHGKTIRAEQTGPVFSLTPQGRLHMRYSARSKNIIWDQHKDTQNALEFLQELLNSDSSTGKSISGSEYIIKRKLSAGQGIISRNILHCRTAFEDKQNSQQQRLLFRGRFYDEIS